jgi:hypothetical protein
VAGALVAPDGAAGAAGASVFDVELHAAAPAVMATARPAPTAQRRRVELSMVIVSSFLARLGVAPRSMEYIRGSFEAGWFEGAAGCGILSGVPTNRFWDLPPWR